MAKKAKVELPTGPLPELIRWWKSQGTPGVVIGGLAVSLLSKPRVTADIDGLVLLSPKRWAAFLKAGRKFGFVPRDPDPLETALRGRVLLLRHAPTGISVDVTFGELPLEEEIVARATKLKVAGATVPLATPEDLIIMKAIAHRPQDLLDIDALLAAYPSFDVERVRRWVKAFADMIEDRAILDALESRLTPQPIRKRRKKK